MTTQSKPDTAAAKLNRLRDCLETTLDALAQSIAERDRLNEEIEVMEKNADSYQRQIRSMITYD